MLRHLVIAAVLAALVGPGAAAAAERVILVQHAATDVKAYAGVAIFSRWDGSAFHLVASRAGGRPVDLPVPAQSEPFDADIGPDESGRPAVVISRCDRAANDCDLYLLRFGSSRPVPVRSTDDPQRREVAPTIWRGRVAWARRTESERAEQRIYTRRLADPAATRSVALPGVPKGGAVHNLELSARHLAVYTVFEPADGSGICGQREIRLIGLKSRRVQVIGSQICGLAGQSWAGPTFDRLWLYFARFCAGAGDVSCRSFGAYRYHLRSQIYQVARFSRRLTGWAHDASGRAYEGRNPSGECARSDFPPCSVVRVSGLRFSPTRPPLPRTRSSRTREEQRHAK